MYKYNYCAYSSIEYDHLYSAMSLISKGMYYQTQYNEID